MIQSTILWLFLTIALLALGEGFYLPGVQPKNYYSKEPVDLKVNHLTSYKTQLPYEYYSLPFCRPEKVKEKRESLGEVLTGQVIENSPYEINFGVEKRCALLCRKEYTFFQTNRFVQKIKENYAINWIMDNLPSAVRIPETEFTEIEYFQGFPLGGTLVDSTGKTLEHFVNNHHRIIIKYHLNKLNVMAEDVSYHQMKDGFDDNEYQARIVGLDVEPFSVRHHYEGEWDDKTPPALTSCEDLRRELTRDYVMQLDGFDDSELSAIGKDSNSRKRIKKRMKQKTEVIWTYDVIWEYSETKWASRWDVYLNANKKENSEVHWFAIVNSMLIVLFLTGMVAMILMRTLNKDLSRYNRIPTEEERAEDREETGWKLVHGDVFRAPKRPMLFAVTIGSGMQFLYMSIITLGFAFIGFLSPARRGSLMFALLMMFLLMGIAGGYYSARVYKGYGGKEWQKCTLMTVGFYPGIITGCLFLLNLIIWAEGSSNAIPFLDMVIVLFLWFGISVPLTFLGAFYGYKQDVIEPPVKTHDIPRAIPEQPWYMSSTVTVLMGGILPFGAVFVELFFVLSSLWMDQYYYVFGFLSIVFVILMITCAEITIVLCYFQLCGEDYHWKWRSLLTSGSCAFYLFFYSLIYFSGKLQIDMFVSALLYIGYMFILSLMFFLVTSVVGYIACNHFVYKIYGSVKVD